MAYNLPQVQCYGKLDVAILKWEPNPLRDYNVVKQIKRLLPQINKMGNKHLLISYVLWTMQEDETADAFLRIASMRINDNEND